mmetsp:Transcript_11489/g.16386  ORF Transcript_11489/g.16386 Transcript_11489/m.16386 type:complete len:103 (+) Transcript_11489:346-654(+)
MISVPFCSTWNPVPSGYKSRRIKTVTITIVLVGDIETDGIFEIEGIKLGFTVVEGEYEGGEVVGLEEGYVPGSKTPPSLATKLAVEEDPLADRLASTCPSDG